MNFKITRIGLLTYFLILSASLSAQDPTFEWSKSIGGLQSDIGNDITTDDAGNVYQVGYFMASVDFKPGDADARFTSRGYMDIFIQKMDAEGQILWVKQIGGGSEEYGVKIVTDVDGNVYVTGMFAYTVDFDPGPGVYNLTATKDYDIHVFKLDTDGNFLWAKQIGGNRNDYGKGITLDSDSNVYVTGFFRETVDFDPGPDVYNLTEVGKSDIFLLKLDTDGNFIWVKQIAGTQSEYGNDLAVDKNDNIYMTGTFKATTDFDPSAATFELTSTGNEDVFVLKMDKDGNFIWVRQLGSVGPMDALGISVDSEGSVYTTGSFMGTVDLDPGAGNRIFTTRGGFDVFIQKMDLNGNFLWGHAMGGPGDDFGYSITNDVNGKAYVIGHFSNTANFDSGAGQLNLTSLGGMDIFILQFHSNGEFGWLERAGGALNDYGYAIFAGYDGSIYATGSFNGQADFNQRGSDGVLTSKGDFDCFMLKLSVEILGMEESSLSDRLLIYPNPTKDNVSVTFKSEQPKVSVRLLSLKGQKLMEKQFSNTKKITLALNQPNGLYLLEIFNGTFKQVIKIIKE